MEINYKNYSHLSFDLWLTLIKSNPEFKQRRNLLFKDFFEINHGIEKVNEVVRYYDVLCNTINEKTGLNLDTYEIYYLILSALDVDMDQNGTDRLSQFYDHTEELFLEFKPVLIYPEIQKMFKDVTDQGKTINILSNTAFIKGRTLRKVLQHYELSEYFKFHIYSDEVGFSKPNQQIFQLVLDEIETYKKIEKKDVLHIGDNPIADYNGALEFGFNAHLLKN
ncbi:HAD-IA family hydrolase [Flavobacterium sp. Fl-318]|uniref:HAD-IA family hydrolase n=1 Tax=Flavobacterium cupriresistens TaxID=2893885 RepID=A0ABU4RB18_9FLAO|nr:MULTISPECIES: HAD-IA family hydrolase [unclassified Flavobacterium]MDX6188844.1 HAD-IA family hydrolase [Flavobacterium sp. Fl-318]UFH44370.1 HAD family hydrolase [Flavobacterium sp. F-323]